MMFNFKCINTDLDIKIEFKDEPTLYLHEHDTMEGYADMEIIAVYFNDKKFDCSDSLNDFEIKASFCDNNGVSNSCIVLLVSSLVLLRMQIAGFNNVDICNKYISTEDTKNRFKTDILEKCLTYSSVKINEREKILRARDIKIDNSTMVSITKVEKNENILYPYYITLDGYDISYIANEFEYLLSENQFITEKYLDKSKENYYLTLYEVKNICLKIAKELNYDNDYIDLDSIAI